MSIKPKTKEDLTGRNRFAKNVLYSWGGYMVNIVTGLVMPRLISDRLGQSTLGIWDFSWIIVSYFGLVQLGLNASVNRYVAHYRAKGDVLGLSGSVSTIALFLKLAGVFILLLSPVMAMWGVSLFGGKLGTGLNDARLVVLFLGLEIGFAMLMNVYSGVLIGCHRYDLHNTTTTISYALFAAGSIVALYCGATLPWLAFTHLVANSGMDLTRWFMARKICPELEINYRRARWSFWWEQARYSVKSLGPRVAGMLSGQCLALLITLFLGPASLAVFSRPSNLLARIHTLAAKFGFVLLPTVSSLHAQSDQSGLRETFRQTTSAIGLILIPLMTALAIYGDELIRVWMGAQYVYPGLMSVLSVGSLFSYMQEPIWSILSGLNQHGRTAVAKLAGAAFTAVTLAIGLGVFHWNLIGAALGLTIPMVVVDGLITPVLACRKLGLPLKTYYIGALGRPLLCALPFAGCLVFARWQLTGKPWVAVAVALVGCAILSVGYWGFAFTPELRGRLSRRLFKRPMESLA